MVPPKTLVPGAWYEFKLVGSSVANASYTGSSLVRVMAGYSPVTAVIAGGDRVVSRLSTITMDGSGCALFCYGLFPDNP